MSKPKKRRIKRTPERDESKQALPQADDPAEPLQADLEAAAPTEDDDPRWTVSEWKGLPNYECRSCSFATVDRSTAEWHFMAEHAPSQREPAAVVNTGLVAKDGSPIMRTVEPFAQVTED